jgi:hypothetical protein
MTRSNTPQRRPAMDPHPGMDQGAPRVQDPVRRPAARHRNLTPTTRQPSTQSLELTPAQPPTHLIGLPRVDGRRASRDEIAPGCQGSRQLGGATKTRVLRRSDRGIASGAIAEAAQCLLDRRFRVSTEGHVRTHAGDPPVDVAPSNATVASRGGAAVCRPRIRRRSPVARCGSELSVGAGGCFDRASDSKGRLQAVTYRAASKHFGGSCNRRNEGSTTGAGRRRRRHAHLWRI